MDHSVIFLEDLRLMLERAIKDTKESHSIQCERELQKNLQNQQETFSRIVEAERTHNQQRLLDSQFHMDYM
jgi:hypothetical protein